MFYKIVVLKDFAKFTGKHLCQCPTFNKIAGLSLQLPVNFAKFLRIDFLKEHFGNFFKVLYNEILMKGD